MRKVSLARAGAFVLVVLVVLTLALAAASGVAKFAAEDMFTTIDERAKPTEPHTHTPYGRWLATQLTQDIDVTSPVAFRARADELNYRSDRLSEAGAVPALIGMLIALLTGAPGSLAATRR